MEFGRFYYVALLSAAAMHGASHQAPQVFQVVTGGFPAPRDRDLARVRLRFSSSKHIAEDDVTRIAVPTGYASVSSRETTVIDLIGHPRVSGGYGNVATILACGDRRAARVRSSPNRSSCCRATASPWRASSVRCCARRCTSRSAERFPSPPTVLPGPSSRSGSTSARGPLDRARWAAEGAATKYRRRRLRSLVDDHDDSDDRAGWRHPGVQADVRAGPPEGTDA